MNVTLAGMLLGGWVTVIDIAENTEWPEGTEWTVSTDGTVHDEKPEWHGTRKFTR